MCDVSTRHPSSWIILYGVLCRHPQAAKRKQTLFFLLFADYRIKHHVGIHSHECQFSFSFLVPHAVSFSECCRINSEQQPRIKALHNFLNVFFFLYLILYLHYANYILVVRIAHAISLHTALFLVWPTAAWKDPRKLWSDISTLTRVFRKWRQHVWSIGRTFFLVITSAYEWWRVFTFKLDN